MKYRGYLAVSTLHYWWLLLFNCRQESIASTLPVLSLPETRYSQNMIWSNGIWWCRVAVAWLMIWSEHSMPVLILLQRCSLICWCFVVFPLDWLFGGDGESGDENLGLLSGVVMCALYYDEKRSVSKKESEEEEVFISPNYICWRHDDAVVYGRLPLVVVSVEEII